MLYGFKDIKNKNFMIVVVIFLELFIDLDGLNGLLIMSFLVFCLVGVFVIYVVN